MPEPASPTVPSVYQLRVVLRGISPLVWRRLLVRSDTTVAGLHAIFQTAFCWDGSHLHRFVVHGTEYGICYYGGPVFRDDPAKVSLADLELRVGERFDYDYDFTDDWHHDIRVEQIFGPEPRHVYPVCIGGRRAGPPDDCGGPWAFLDQTQPYRIFAAMTRVAEILGEILDDITVRDDYYEELVCLHPLLVTERFDRQAINRTLAELSVRRERAA